MNQPVVPLGIRFDEFVFSEVQPIGQWIRPQCPGVLALLVRSHNWAPKPFEPLYFEEFGNNAPPLFSPAHASSLTHARRLGDLYVSVLPMPFSTAAQRSALRDHLIRVYNPAWQSRCAPAPELERKLNELEKKTDEQTNQLRLLVETMTRLFEPQPVPPRRSIGFLAQPLRQGTPEPAY